MGNVAAREVVVDAEHPERVGEVICNCGQTVESWDEWDRHAFDLGTGLSLDTLISLVQRMRPDVTRSEVKVAVLALVERHDLSIDTKGRMHG